MKDDVQNPKYIDGDITLPVARLLEQFYSKGELKRLIEQKGITTGTPHPNELWVKVGRQLYIFQPKFHFIATQAQIWWEYHFELMPKKIEWKTVERVDKSSEL